MPPRSTRRPSAGSMRKTLSCRARRSVATAMSTRRAAKLHSVLDVDVVRTVDSRDHLADLTVHAEDHDGTGRRGDLHRAEDQAARRDPVGCTQIAGSSGSFESCAVRILRLLSRAPATAETAPAAASSSPRPVPASCVGIRTRRSATRIGQNDAGRALRRRPRARFAAIQNLNFNPS